MIKNGETWWIELRMWGQRGRGKSTGSLWNVEDPHCLGRRVELGLLEARLEWLVGWFRPNGATRNIYSGDQ